MVEFGLAFQRSRRPEWVRFYVDYDALKRLLATAPWEFLAKLVQDIETCALHSLEEAGRIATLLHTSQAEAGLEALLRLVAFVELNLVAVRKILKKHDKTFEPCTRAVARTAHMRLLESFERQWPALLRTGMVRGAPPQLAAECSRAVERCSAARAGLRVRYASLNVVDADLASSEAALGLAGDQPEVFANVQYAGAFLFAASCYAITPTMHAYATSVGAPRAFGGLLLGASTVAALASTAGCGCVGRRFGFRAPLVAGAALGGAGQLLYALAPSVARSSGSARAAQGCALAGRLLLGLGSTEPVNRRYIGEAVPPSKRIAAAAKFVAAGATGMGCGPLLSGLLSFLLARDDGARPRDHVFELKVDSTVAPALLLSVAWCLLAFYVASAFREPPARASGAYGAVGAEAPARRQRSASELLTEGAEAAPLRAALFGVVAFEAACEVFLGSTSAVSSLAFGWQAHDIGAFLGVVCLLTMPLSKMVEAAAATFDDREILFAATAATAGGALALATATGFAYVWAAAGGALFLGASTMESALMSLIGQWAKRDAGVLVTLFGAGGRLVGDGVVFAAFAADHPGEGPARLALSLFGPVFGLLAATVALLALSLVQRRRNTKPVEPSDDARRRAPGEDRRLMS